MNIYETILVQIPKFAFAFTCTCMASSIGTLSCST